MSPEEAALAAGEINTTLAVPMHYGSLPEDQKDAGRFLDLSPVPIALLPVTGRKI